MPDRTPAQPEDDEEVLAIGTLRCRACWQVGRDTRIVLQVPSWAKAGYYCKAICPQCAIRPEAPLLYEERGIFDLIAVKKITAS
jgi:hypothetical protein